MTPEWLPEAVDQDNSMTDELFAKFVYDTIFVRDFISSLPVYAGTKLAIKYNPWRQGFCATFWHIISEGADEDHRVIVPGRCARVPWIRPIIEACGDSQVRIWSNRRKGSERILLWLNPHQFNNYLVILEKRQETAGTVILLWTAYPVTYAHAMRKLEQEYQQYLRDCESRQ